MPFEDKRSQIAPMVRDVISAWIVFLAMFLGSVLFSTIDAVLSDPALSDPALSDPAGLPVAGNQVVTVEDLRVEPTETPGEFAQKNPAESGATE